MDFDLIIDLVNGAQRHKSSPYGKRAERDCRTVQRWGWQPISMTIRYSHHLLTLLPLEGQLERHAPSLRFA
jgi:hypothetical protein